MNIILQTRWVIAIEMTHQCILKRAEGETLRFEQFCGDVTLATADLAACIVVWHCCKFRRIYTVNLLLIQVSKTRIYSDIFGYICVLIISISIIFRSRKVLLVAAIHWQTLPAGPRSYYWCWVWSTNDYYWWKTNQTADLG